MKLRRSMMFIPGDNAGMLSNSYIYSPDSVMFDLEDAVSINEKDSARLLVYNTLKANIYGGIETVVRINGVDTPYWEDDLDMAVRGGVQVIRLPKTESVNDVREIEERIEKIERSCGRTVGDTKIITAIESASGVVNAVAIAACSERMLAIALAGFDYLVDMQTERSSGTEPELFYARAAVLHAARAAKSPSEGGAEGRYGVLKNIMGLWLLQRVLKEQNITDLTALIAETEKLKACTFLINPNDDRFINPAHMSAEIQAACVEAGQPVPSSPAELARCIFDSLALLYADILSELAELRGKPFSQLHIVGGGCQNQLLNQLCADACGITVVAGPVEASTLGNIGIQLMTLDELSNVDDFRSVVRANTSLTTFTPHPCHEIARYRAQFQQKRLTKELCA